MAIRRKNFRRLGDAVAVCFFASLATTAAAAGIEAGRQSEILYLLEHDCGSCHGMKRGGGLGPPLDADTLAGRSAEALVEIILDGAPGTPMPPWRPFLTPREARWLVEFMQHGKPAQ